ncbi:MAG: PilN domain-containing protein [Longimicrobiales bacterium]
MIEINLLPGGSGRRAGRRAGAGFKLPKLALPGRMPQLDRMTMFVVAAWIIGPLLLVWLFLSARNERNDLTVAIEQAQEDSARYAGMIESVTRLQARQDTIAQKLEIVQEIDAGRYVWAHILDEISRALPAYTWLTQITPSESAGAGEVVLLINGRTGNNFALTEFLQQLEASPFLQRVTLVSTEQVLEGESLVYSFAVQVSYEEPPGDAIQTVPLFVGQVNGATSD